MNITARNRSPFTASQRQELEDQALIFKYIVSGVPIPPDLIFSVKRSLEYPLMSPRPFSHQLSSCFDRKADPEPGRCRRTDGKKWRCSKEAYPDSKYCERHMHRGRNRSRKPVEAITSTQSSPSMSSMNTDSHPTTTAPFSLPTPSSSITPDTISPYHPLHKAICHPFHPLSSSKPSDSCFSPQNNTGHHLFLDSAGSYSKADKDYRYVHGMRDGILDERTFFPEASGTIGNLPMTMSSSSGYSRLHFKNATDNSKHQKIQQEEQDCFVLGTNFHSPTPIKVERSGEETKKPFHQFLGNWLPKSRENLLDIEENQSNHPSFSATELSISTPLSTQELFASKSNG